MGIAHPFAELDALRTERNAAVAEAKLWLRRMLQMQKKRDQANADLYACDKCLGEWQTAYEDLLRAFRRLEVAYGHAMTASETANFLIDHLQPLAMAQLERLIDEAPECAQNSLVDHENILDSVRPAGSEPLETVFSGSYRARVDEPA